MKRFIFLIIITVTISSCKKKYNCHCNTTVLFPSSGRQGSYNSSTVKMDTKMTKKQATSICADEAKNIDATYTNFVTNNGTSSSGGVTAHTNCSIL